MAAMAMSTVGVMPVGGPASGLNEKSGDVPQAPALVKAKKKVHVSRDPTLFSKKTSTLTFFIDFGE